VEVCPPRGSTKLRKQNRVKQRNIHIRGVIHGNTTNTALQ
jgi:hypothetical protein